MISEFSFYMYQINVVEQDNIEIRRKNVAKIKQLHLMLNIYWEYKKYHSN